MFKKSLALLLTLLFSVSLVACNETEKELEVIEGTAYEDTADDYVKLCDYKKIEIDWESESNSATLDNALSSYTAETKQVKDRAIKNGDVANIDFTGYKDGKKFEGGESKGYDLTIGSNQFIEGFEDGLIGVKPGETVDLDLTFPEDYGSADLAGAAVVFKVKVNHITEKVYKDEDMAKAKESVYSTVVLNHMIENSKFKSIPKTNYDNYEKLYKSTYESQATQMGYETLDAYLQATNYSAEQFQEMMNEACIEAVKSDLIILAVAKKEGYKFSEKEYKTLLTQVAGNNDISTIEETYGKTMLRAVFFTEDVTELLVSNIKK